MQRQCEANAVTIGGCVKERGRENEREDEREGQEQKPSCS